MIGRFLVLLRGWNLSGKRKTIPTNHFHLLIRLQMVYQRGIEEEGEGMKLTDLMSENLGFVKNDVWMRV